MSANPLRQLVVARRLARQHGLMLKEKLTDDGQTIFLFYRILPDGRPSFLGKRGTPSGACAYVARLAKFR